MPSDVTRDEFDHVVARVDGVERGLQDKKAMMRQILAETRRQGDLITDIQALLGGVERRVAGVERCKGRIEKCVGGVERRLGTIEMHLDGIEGHLGGCEAHLRGIGKKLDDFAQVLPQVVRDAMRKALCEYDKR